MYSHAHMTATINIKWGKEVFKDIEVDLSQEVIVFKSQIYALTNVPTDTQKILIKGKTVKDDSDLS